MFGVVVKLTANVDYLRGFSEWHKTKLQIKTQAKQTHNQH
jgi:hypothetical protein